MSKLKGKSMWWYLIGSYLLWVVTFQLIGFLIGMMHKVQVHTWYITLYKSALTPPGQVFSVVWPILYTLLAVAGCMLWRQKRYEKAKKFFLFQMILNWSWTTAFFQFHMLLLSWLIIVVMIIMTIAIMVETYKKLKPVTLLLMPYLVWISFALYLNVFVWIYN